MQEKSTTTLTVFTTGHENPLRTSHKASSIAQYSFNNKICLIIKWSSFGIRTRSQFIFLIWLFDTHKYKGKGSIVKSKFANGIFAFLLWTRNKEKRKNWNKIWFGKNFGFLQLEEFNGMLRHSFGRVVIWYITLQTYRVTVCLDKW